MKIKEIEKRDKYLYLARKLRKLRNMKKTEISIVIGDLRTIPKGLVKGLEELEIGGREEIIQTTALLRSTRILRRLLETKEKNPEGVMIIMMIIIGYPSESIAKNSYSTEKRS